MVLNKFFSSLLMIGVVICFIGIEMLGAMKQEEPIRQKELELIQASEEGSEPTVKRLLEEGVNVNAQDKLGMTPLMMAALGKHKKIIFLLIDAGADTEINDVYRRKARDRVDQKGELYQLLTTAEQRNYRNLIIIIESGRELFWDMKNVNGLPVLAQIMIRNFVVALNQECAFILIPAAFWDYFLNAKITQSDYGAAPFSVECKKLVDCTRWDVYKICLDPQADIKPKDQAADFYIFCPKYYKEMLLETSTIPKIKQVLAKIPEPIDQETSRKIQIINQTPDLGIVLPEEYKVQNPLEEKGDLIGIFNDYAAQLKQYEIDKSIQDPASFLSSRLWDYYEKLDQTLGDKFLRCLNQIFFLKQTTLALNAITIENTSILPRLPQFNICIHGHGGSTKMVPQLESLIKRAQKLGYWPSNERKILSTEITTGKFSPTIQKSKLLEFKKEQEQIGQQFLGTGWIAMLPANIFGKILDFFNGITNFLFVSTCHAAGMHLVLPFVFMASPSLSYTLVAGALLDTPSYGSLPSVMMLSETQQFVGTKLLFYRFFDGLCDFNLFIKNENQTILESEMFRPKSEARNYFSRLLNYVANFLDSHGEIEKLSNTPWIKLPGSTDWQVVSHMDDQVLVITDVMMLAKKYEHTTSELGQKPLGVVLKESVKKPEKGPELTKKPEAWSQDKWDSWKKRWGKWEQERQLLKPSDTIEVGDKKLIFVTISDVWLPINFGHTTEIKTIIPLARQRDFSAGNVLCFKKILSDDPFTDFFNKVLKPNKPLTLMPDRTIFFIENLRCKNDLPRTITLLPAGADIELKNCIVVFGPPEMTSFDFYFTCEGKFFGVKRDIAPQEISLDEAFIKATDDKNTTLANKLIQLGAQPKPSQSGRTAFMTAALADSTAAIDSLIKRGINPNAKDENGNTALILAASAGSAFSVDRLIKANALLDERNNDGCTALLLAAEQGHTAAVDLLVKAKADLNIQSNLGRTALIEAVRNKHNKIVQILLNAGADITMHMYGGETVLDIATTPEIKSLIIAAIFQRSPDLKKEMQMAQQQVACEIWRQKKKEGKTSGFDAIIQDKLVQFRAKVQKLRI